MFFVYTCNAQFSKLSREVELKRHALEVLDKRLGESSHSKLESMLAEATARLEEEIAAVDAAKEAGAAAAEK